MNIKIIKDHSDGRRTYKKGKIISVSDDTLIKEKIAVLASDGDYEAQQKKKNEKLDEEHKIK